MTKEEPDWCWTCGPKTPPNPGEDFWEREEALNDAYILGGEYRREGADLPETHETLLLEFTGRSLGRLPRSLALKCADGVTNWREVFELLKIGYSEGPDGPDD